MPLPLPFSPVVFGVLSDFLLALLELLGLTRFERSASELLAGSDCDANLRFLPTCLEVLEMGMEAAVVLLLVVGYNIQHMSPRVCCKIPETYVGLEQ